MARTDAEERLLRALKERLQADGRSVRSIETEIGLAHGTLGHVLRGQSELRFHHLERLGSILGFTVPEIVAEAYGDVREHEELRKLLSEVVRSELAALRRG